MTATMVRPSTGRSPVVQAAVEQFFNSLEQRYGTPATGWAPGLGSAWSPSCDIIDSKDVIRIALELPGCSKNDVHLTVEGNTLYLSGEKRQDSYNESSDRVFQMERQYGRFERSFNLPTSADSERIQSQFENGVLTVTIPKTNQSRGREIPIR